MPGDRPSQSQAHDRTPTSSALIVVAPGMLRDIGSWHSLREVLEARALFPYASAEWLIHDHRISAWSRRRLAAAARVLEARITEHWHAAGGYDDLVMVGHSVGALLVRKAWLNCVDPGQGSDYTKQKWGESVSRFVLFAGLSRGVDTERSIRHRIAARGLELVPGAFSMEDCFAGSPFITSLRIAWMRQMANLPADRRPITVQFLGSEDEIVRREDSIDLDAFPDNPIWNLAGATHSDPHRFDRAADPEARLRRFADAFQFAPDPRAEGSGHGEPRVLMIVHGIRASRTDDWVKRAEETAKRLPGSVTIETPTYGYLSALRFALPVVRRRYARYFRDFYTQTLARHRGARISVLCHSNGSYAVGHSLREIEAITLNRVALAGSVLPSDYQWDALIQSGRVGEVRNDGASRDVPVALLCNALRGLGMRDVGTGGFSGFLGSGVREVRFHAGGHGAMLGQDNLESMLRFLLGAAPQSAAAPLLEDAPVTRRLSRLMPYLAATAGLLLLALVGWAILEQNWPGLAIGIGALLLLLLLLDIA